MAELRAYGLSVQAPTGWDGEIYQRADVAFTPQSTGAATGTDIHAVEHHPIVHLCSRPLPAERGDFGGGVVSLLGPADVFVVVFQYGTDAVGTPLFAASGVPWPLALEAFDTTSLRMPLPGQLGCQRFFTVGGRAFMLYVVLGSSTLRRALVPSVNTALRGVVLG